MLSWPIRALTRWIACSRPERQAEHRPREQRAAIDFIESPPVCVIRIQLGPEPHRGAVGDPPRQLAASRVDVVAARLANRGDDAVLIENIAKLQDGCRAASGDSACRETH